MSSYDAEMLEALNGIWGLLERIADAIDRLPQGGASPAAPKVGDMTPTGRIVSLGQPEPDYWLIVNEEDRK